MLSFIIFTVQWFSIHFEFYSQGISFFLSKFFTQKNILWTTKGRVWMKGYSLMVFPYLGLKWFWCFGHQSSFLCLLVGKTQKKKPEIWVFEYLISWKFMEIFCLWFELKGWNFLEGLWKNSKKRKKRNLEFNVN